MEYSIWVVALAVVVVCGVIAIRNDIRRLKAQAEKEASKVMSVPAAEYKPLTVPVSQVVKHKQSKKRRKRSAKLKAGA